MLTIVGLPLGNIEDISIRAFKALFSADVVIAEDTRNYLKIKSILKERFAPIAEELGINLDAKPDLISYREQNHDQVIGRLIEILKTKNAILISDAGMPAISDPGYKLIEAAIRNKIEVDVIPSATAIETALVLSGLPTDRFTFLGFLPRTVSKIKTLIAKSPDTTIIFYESPFRLPKTLEGIKEIFPEAKVAACNDLTKKFQKVVRGNADNVISELSTIKIQGEWVVVLRNS